MPGIATLTNSTNFSSGIQSYLTVSSSVSLYSLAGGGGSGALSFDTPNLFLQNIIRGTGNYQPTGVLLLYFNIAGALATASSSQFTLDFKIVGDDSNIPSTFSSIIMNADATSIYPASVVAVSQVSEIISGSNNSLGLNITNNSTGLGTPPAWIMSSISSFIPVTYLPLGFQTN